MSNKILGYYTYSGTKTYNFDICEYVQIELKGSHAESKNAIALISKQDLSYILEFKWFLGKDGYPIAFQSINKKMKFGKGIKMHQLIMPKINKGYAIDHINRNKLDNRLINLRICTQKENSYNTSKPKNSKSKYKGVKKDAKGTWTAYITKDHKKTEIKGIITEEEAAKIYDMMAEDLFGDYAGKNFLGDC